MRHLVQILSFFILAPIFAGCALEPVDLRKPIENSSSGFAIEYKQNGRPVNLDELVSQLSREPAAGTELEGFRTLHIPGILTGSAGGACVGYGLGSALGGKSVDPALWIAGGGLIAASAVLEYYARRKLERAVDAHNASLTERSGGGSGKRARLGAVVAPLAGEAGAAAFLSITY